MPSSFINSESAPTGTSQLAALRRLFDVLRSCRLCPRQCGTNRREGKTGACGATLLPRVASANVHHGEEPPISGERGSGTIFFSHCSLHCVFCQNWPISQKGVGEVITIDALAEKMLELQERSVHNINLVNPTHYWPQIAAAVFLARRRGLTIPVLGNTNGFERAETLELVSPFVELWLPDIKYDSARTAKSCSGAALLPHATWRAVGWMLKHAGPLQVDDHGIATRGVLIRHLVLPERLDESRLVLRGIKRRFGQRTPLALMTQYFPAYRAHDKKGLHRHLSAREKQRAERMLLRLGLAQGWRQIDG
jgi:putative pyruvate formate lyase activating enzyme